MAKENRNKQENFSYSRQLYYRRSIQLPIINKPAKKYEKVKSAK